MRIVPSNHPALEPVSLQVRSRSGCADRREEPSAGPFVSPPVTAVLLDSVPKHLAGTASGVFNTSRQVGGALAVAVFGALLAQSATFMHGLRMSLLLASGVSLATAVTSLRLRTPTGALAGGRHER
jgi:MFS family permease